MPRTAAKGTPRSAAARATAKASRFSTAAPVAPARAAGGRGRAGDGRRAGDVGDGSRSAAASLARRRASLGAVSGIGAGKVGQAAGGRRPTRSRDPAGDHRVARWRAAGAATDRPPRCRPGSRRAAAAPRAGARRAQGRLHRSHADHRPLHPARRGRPARALAPQRPQLGLPGGDDQDHGAAAIVGRATSVPELHLAMLAVLVGHRRGARRSPLTRTLRPRRPSLPDR